VNYGWRMALLVTGVFYAAMVLAGYVVELLFCRDRHHPLIPEARNAKVIEAGISWNYTISLNLALLAITTILLVRSYAPAGYPCSRCWAAAPTPTTAIMMTSWTINITVTSLTGPGRRGILRRTRQSG
jgi:hypothetical protein